MKRSTSADVCLDVPVALFADLKHQAQLALRGTTRYIRELLDAATDEAIVNLTGAPPPTADGVKRVHLRLKASTVTRFGQKTFAHPKLSRAALMRLYLADQVQVTV